MRKAIGVLIIGFSLFIQSCCAFIKENDLGNNFRLSEFDNVARRILYAEEKCSNSGIEIVPMTVTAYASNSKWIIAKVRKPRSGMKYEYWIIQKVSTIEGDTEKDRAENAIKNQVTGPLDSSSFLQRAKANDIDLILKKI